MSKCFYDCDDCLDHFHMEGGLGLAASKPLSWSTSRWPSSSSNILISISKVPPLVPSEGKVYFFVRFPKEFAQQTTLIPYNLVQLSTNHYGYEKITAWVQVTPVAGSTSSRPGSGQTLMSTITTGDHGEKYSFLWKNVSHYQSSLSFEEIIFSSVLMLPATNQSEYVERLSGWSLTGCHLVSHPNICNFLKVISGDHQSCWWSPSW